MLGVLKILELEADADLCSLYLSIFPDLMSTYNYVCPFTPRAIKGLDGATSGLRSMKALATASGHGMATVIAK